MVRPVVIGWADDASALPRSFRIFGYIFGSLLIVAAVFWGFRRGALLAAGIFAVLGMLVLLASSERLTLPEELFTAEPIDGWRQWRILRAAGTTSQPAPLVLAGLADNQVWDARSAEAGCVQGMREWDGSPASHSAPDPLCSCGIHAWRDRAQAVSFHPVVTAVGEVRLWGEVLEAEHGYRAQYAELAANLGVLISCRARTEQCGEVVGVTEDSDGFKPYCAHHAPDPDDPGTAIYLDSFMEQLETDLGSKYGVEISPVR